ncbi:MAG: hypothetical protein JW808_02710 [Victivallales bacterium]|nr:hypothetical protein [Victivallales bacterium]
MKLNQSFSKEFKRSPLKYSTGFFVLFMLAALLIYQLRDYFTWIVPDKDSADGARKELLNSQEELQAAINTRHKLLARRRHFIANGKNFWIPRRDGDTGINIQKMLNKTAEDTAVVLSSVGVARTEKVTDGISLVNLSIRSQGQSKDLVQFVNELAKQKPTPLWRSLVMRPENPASPNELVISGNIQFILITDEKLATLLQEGGEL